MAKHEYLTAAEEASYGRFEAPEQAVLERFFFLDNADLDLVAKGCRETTIYRHPEPAGDTPRNPCRKPAPEIKCWAA
jgi:hypothetical protein